MKQSELGKQTISSKGAVEELCRAFEPDQQSSYSYTAQKAAYLARLLHQRAVELQTPQEKKQQAELERMMQNPKDKSTLMRMTDQAFRSHNPHRAVDQLVHVLDVQGVPRFFSRVERALLRGFQSFGGYLPGGTATALRLLEEKSDLNLLAEIGGKNATIVTALSDREQAINHVLQSAFGHSGQKCSATSLLILEQEVYDDPSFKATLCDAAKSLRTGSAWEFHTTVGPLIHPPSGALDTAFKELEPGESWALMPKRLEQNSNLYSPGVKWGVQPGSFTHTTELFGPVLGVMKAKNLEHAIALANQTGNGLTSGLESLDDREQELWLQRVRAGNLYLNRVTTGAVVLRQPFGGMGRSAFGPGIKVGGPNYLAQLMDFRNTGVPRTGSGIADPELRVRVHSDDTAFELFARVCAAKTVGSRVTVSYPKRFRSSALEVLERLTESWGGRIEFIEETDARLATVIVDGHTERVRYAAADRAPIKVLHAVGDSGIYVIRAPVLPVGRIELLWYLREQSISFAYHRYGNLAARAGEERSPVL